VLDIAGGAGSLSFCLHALHGVRCTTIDPRPAKLSKQHRRHLASLKACAGAAAAAPEVQAGEDAPRLLSRSGAERGSAEGESGCQRAAEDSGLDELYMADFGSAFLDCVSVADSEDARNRDEEWGMNARTGDAAQESRLKASGCMLLFSMLLRRRAGACPARPGHVSSICTLLRVWWGAASGLITRQEGCCHNTSGRNSIRCCGRASMLPICSRHPLLLGCIQTRCVA
jgi:hypothetical protein